MNLAQQCLQAIASKLKTLDDDLTELDELMLQQQVCVYVYVDVYMCMLDDDLTELDEHMLQQQVCVHICVYVYIYIYIYI